MEQLSLFDKKKNERIINGSKIDPISNDVFYQSIFTRSIYGSVASTNLNYDWGSTNFTTSSTS